MRARLQRVSVIALVAWALIVAACAGGPAPANHANTENRSTPDNRAAVENRAPTPAETRASPVEEQKGGDTRGGDRKPDCGRGFVLGEASKTYDDARACAADRDALQDKAKEDAAAKCKSFCTTLSEKCVPRERQPAPDVDGPDCNKTQEDKKVRARATALLDCTCQPKP